MHLALAAMAQSTNLLSSGAAVMRCHLNEGDICLTFFTFHDRINNVSGYIDTDVTRNNLGIFFENFIGDT
jgi:hypothetical protein